MIRLNTPVIKYAKLSTSWRSYQRRKPRAPMAALMLVMRWQASRPRALAITTLW